MNRIPETPHLDSNNAMFANSDVPYVIVGDYPAEAVVDIVVPGRGRTEDGMDVTPSGAARIGTAARFFFDYNLLSKGGYIVSSGAATPGDKAGPILGDVTRGEDFPGIPEAVAADRRLGELGVPRESRLKEVLSIDTATNFAFTERVLRENGAGPERGLGVVCQAGQLERIMDEIAPKVTSRPIIGIQVPEISGQEEPDSFQAKVFSKLVVRGMYPDHPDLIDTVYDRAERYWKIMLKLQSLLGKSAVYNQNLGQEA
jgi:hypothetical protein